MKNDSLKYRSEKMESIDIDMLEFFQFEIKYYASQEIFRNQSDHDFEITFAGGVLNLPYKKK